LTNPEEEQFLGSTKGQDYIASGLFRAFREYKDEIEGTVKKYDDNFEKQETYMLSKEDSMEVAELRNALKPAIKEDSNKDSAQSKADFKEIIADKKEEKKEEKKDVVEKKNMPIVYKVQIASSDKKIPLDSDKFKGVEKPGEYQDKGIYKYTAGEYSNQSDAVKLQSQLRKQGFKDAFVIAMQDNKRVPLK
jgi:N-acetylmuramoyl-L-alanine amidase